MAQVALLLAFAQVVEPAAWFTLLSLMSFGEPPPFVSSTYQQLLGSRARSSAIEPALTSSTKPLEPDPHSLTTNADVVTSLCQLEAVLSADVGSGRSPSLEPISCVQPTKVRGSTSSVLTAQARLDRVFMMCPRWLESGAHSHRSKAITIARCFPTRVVEFTKNTRESHE